MRSRATLLDSKQENRILLDISRETQSSSKNGVHFTLFIKGKTHLSFKLLKSEATLMEALLEKDDNDTRKIRVRKDLLKAVLILNVEI